MHRPVLFLTLALCLASPGESRAEDPPKDPKRTDVAVVPVAGGDSDIGYGGGAMLSVTKMLPGFWPYRWHLEGASFITFDKPATQIGVPYWDNYLLLDLPGLLGGRLRLTARPSFTRETTLAYWGLGNASTYVPRWEAYDAKTQPVLYDAAKKYNEYARTQAALQLAARVKIHGPFYVRLAATYAQNWVDVNTPSQLTDDRAGARGATVARLLAGPDQHGEAMFEYAFIQDSRDDETNPTRGFFHKLAVRLAPGGSDPLPYRYGGANLTTRFYRSIWKRNVSLALRLVGDLLYGTVPFYELARYDEGYALGGIDGVRGVPAQRYYGKRKVFGNAELRTELPSFTTLKRKITFGLVGFFDTGRVWADDLSVAGLDGTGLGLKYGVGGGLRMGIDSSFVLRADAAWSPDATPIGLYFKAGQTF